MIHTPGHTKAIFNPELFKQIVDECKNALPTDIAAIAGCGNSGIPICSALSYVTGLPMITVRKPDEKSHAGYTVTGYFGPGKYVIIDDLISSGRTIRNIINSIEKKKKDQKERYPDDQGEYMSLRPSAIILYSDLMIGYRHGNPYVQYCFDTDIYYGIPITYINRAKISLNTTWKDYGTN